MRIARLATIVWGVVLLAIAIGARHSQSVLEAGLTIGSIPFGALLGVFLLGVLTKKPREGAAIAGVVVRPGRRPLRPLRDPYRLDLVRADRDHRHLRRRPAGVALRKGPGTRRTLSRISESH